ncbi:hypothetical protein [Halovivax gelatinilyticus]|uniref:hypothetical protein n=1 Tax=Halovivax gelatinilyticus TaxID=2961597 RepID=UPI0020CA8910|nr:hypothetical protein [Halovivax gelatinilyticus]
MSSDGQQWSLTPQTRFGRAVALYAPLAPLAGAFVLVAVGLASLPVFGILTGDGGLALFGIVMLCIGGVSSVLYLGAMARYGENNAKWVEPWVPTEHIDWRVLGGTGLASAAVIVLAVLADPRLFYVALAGVVFAPTASWWFDRSYALDETTLAVEYAHPYREDSSIPLSSVITARWLPVGIRGYRLGFCRRVDGWPFVVPVPADRVEPFDRVVEQTPIDRSESPHPTTTRAMRIICYLVGLGIVALGVGVAVLIGGELEAGLVRTVLAALVVGWVGLLVVGYALRESIRARRIGA